MVFQPGLRYFLSGERITSVNDVDDLFYRIDMPGHIRHNGRRHIQPGLPQLSRQADPRVRVRRGLRAGREISVSAQRRQGPARMIRAYQVKVDGKPGPWLGGLTFDPAEVSEAWCHQRGYVCFIQEMHRRKVKAGETFGAAYAVGFFDDIAGDGKALRPLQELRTLIVEDGKFRLE